MAQKSNAIFISVDVGTYGPIPGEYSLPINKKKVCCKNSCRAFQGGLLVL